MYNNLNQNNSDSDNYYNAYKESMREGENHSLLRKNLKIGFLIFSVSLLSVTAIYLVNHFATERKEYSTFSETLKEEVNSSPKHRLIQLVESSQINNINSKVPVKPISNSIEDRIKNEIISNLSNTPKVLKINNQDVEDIVKIILKEMSNSAKENLEKELIDIENKPMKEHYLKDMNHYNKIVVDSTSQEEGFLNLIEIQNQLNQIIEQEDISENISSEYAKLIKKELIIRSNAMKIIIVQKGDTLSDIALKAYGKSSDYHKIFDANPEILGNPHQIFIGQKLRIPN